MDNLNITPDWDDSSEIITEAPPETEPAVTEQPPAETTPLDTEPSEPEQREPTEPIQEPGFTIDPNPENESDVNLDLLYGDIDGSLSVMAGFLQDIKKADEKTAEQFEILAGQQAELSENSETQLKIFEDSKTFLMYLFIVILAYGIYRIISGVLNGAFGG